MNKIGIGLDGAHGHKQKDSGTQSREALGNGSIWKSWLILMQQIVDNKIVVKLYNNIIRNVYRLGHKNFRINLIMKLFQIDKKRNLRAFSKA